MDRQQEIQESFNKYFQGFFPGKGQSLAFLSSVSSAKEKANDCIKKAKSVAEENNVVASEYYYLAGFVCLGYLLNNGIVDSLYEKGKDSAKKAAEILPQDEEYLIINLFYRILAIKKDNIEAEKAFAILQQIQKECPPFHIIKNTLFSVEWLEDRYNELFEGTLQDVYCKLEEAHSGLCEDAALLLKSFPAAESKLMAFYALSGIYLENDKLDEALRNAKLGVEVLGNNVEYDYHDFSHCIWGECWTLVGNINREKKEYDFAESVLEKGARLGIISCMTSLAEMYENGESDDPDPKEAEKYRNLAKATQEARDKEQQEEEERARREEEARLAEIRRQEEEQRLAEELEARKEEIKRKKSLLWTGIAACAIAIIAGAIYLSTETIVDRVVKYQKAGLAVLNVQKTGPAPYAIVMDKKGIYYDNRFSVIKVLPVGTQINTRDIQLHYDSDGLKALSTEAKQKLAITSSRGYNIIYLSSSSFLLIKKTLSEDLLTTPDVSVNQSYLIVKNAKEKDFGNATVINVPSCKTDGHEHLVWRLYSDIMTRYGTDFRSSFQGADYNKIIERNYGHYVATISLSLIRGTATIIGTVEFDRLKKDYAPKEVGTTAHRESMKKTIRQIFRDELIESFYVNATQLTGISNRRNMRITSDDKYTFVVNPNYYSGNEKMALFRINNKTKEKKLIDSAMEVEYQDYRIRVRKYDTFLIFFDSHKDIYYNYNGALIN